MAGNARRSGRWPRFVRLDDGDMHVGEDGRPGGPAVLLIYGTAASAAWWDPVIPQLAGACRVIRVDLAGDGRSADPPAGITSRAGAVVDGSARPVTAIGHSTGGTWPPPWPSSGRPGGGAGANQHPPGPRRLHRPEPLRSSCWPRCPGGCCGACAPGHHPQGPDQRLHPPHPHPRRLIQGTLWMTTRTRRHGPRRHNYLEQRALPDRLTALGLPVFVIFGADDHRWRSSSAAAYRAVPAPASGCCPAWDTPRCRKTRKQPAPCCWTSPRPPGIPPTAPPLSPSPFRKWRGGHLGYRPGGTCRLQNR